MSKLEFKTNKLGNLEVSFESNINVDNGSYNIPQGKMLSEMELYTNENGTPTGIEWVVYNQEGDAEFVEEIGLFFDGKTLIDYDGVFELPVEAAKLIRKAGYKVSNDFLS
jgi:hypothetical protein